MAPSELLPLRTTTSRTLSLGGGAYRLECWDGPTYAPDESGVLVPLDLRLVPCAGGWRPVVSPYTLLVDDAALRYRLPGMTVELEAVGHRLPRRVKAEPYRDGLLWRGVAPGVDLRLMLLPECVKVLKILHGPDAPRHFSWRFTGCGNLTLPAKGQDADGRQLVLRHERYPAAGGRREVEEWGGFVIARDPVTRVPSLSSQAAYPVEIDPTYPVTTNADNGDTLNSKFYSVGQVAAGYYGMSFQPYYDRFPGVRFTNVTVPQGATVSAASISLVIRKVSSTGGTAADPAIWGDAADDAAAWGDTSRPDQITKTVASYALPTTNPATGSVTRDVTSIVQEIVNRAGWASNNAMRLAWLGTKSSHHYARVMYGSKGNHYGDVPQLSVTYSAGGTVQNAAVNVSLSLGVAETASRRAGATEAPSLAASVTETAGRRAGVTENIALAATSSASSSRRAGATLGCGLSLSPSCSGGVLAGGRSGVALTLVEAVTAGRIAAAVENIFLSLVEAVTPKKILTGSLSAALALALTEQGSRRAGGQIAVGLGAQPTLAAGRVAGALESVALSLSLGLGGSQQFGQFGCSLGMALSIVARKIAGGQLAVPLQLASSVTPKKILFPSAALTLALSTSAAAGRRAGCGVHPALSLATSWQAGRRASGSVSALLALAEACGAGRHSLGAADLALTLSLLATATVFHGSLVPLIVAEFASAVRRGLPVESAVRRLLAETTSLLREE